MIEGDHPPIDEIPDEAVSDNSLTGNLIDLRAFRSGEQPGVLHVLVRCPLDDCDYELENWHHSRSSIQDHLLKDHLPEDFGLSPIRESARQDPKKGVISTHLSSKFYHTRNCSGAVRIDSCNLKTVQIDELGDEYSWCSDCKRRPINIEEIDI